MTRERSERLATERAVPTFLPGGQADDLTTCDRELIHIPGAIQPHGVLLAVDEADVTIRQASANTDVHLGIEASALVGAPLARALGPEPVGRLREALTDPRRQGDDPLIVLLAGGAYEATWHRVDGVVIVELEPAEESASVVTSTLFWDVRQAIDAIQAADGVSQLCEAAAAEVRRLTGYGRVMVYRFHPDEHGEVVAEARAPDLDPYLGQHYPASDIPVQARRLYMLKDLGVIADVDYEPVALVAASGDADGAPLDLSFAALRSVSPFHRAYLRNMGVQATLTISLKRGGRLWGMITCHHRVPRRIGAQHRAACQLLGHLFSLQLAVAEDREGSAYSARLTEVRTHLLERMARAPCLPGALADGEPSGLDLVSADGMVARIDGRTVTAGAVPPAPAIDALLARLSAQDDASELVGNDLPSRFAELEPFAEHASGVLAVSLTSDPQDVVLWFRGELVHTVSWGGNPDKPTTGDPTARPGQRGFSELGPRESFQAWRREVRGTSRPWLEAEVAAARALAAAIPELLLGRARDRLAHLALHDGLTGLPNRALLLRRITQALSGHQRPGRRVALLFVDLDRFKSVNDSLGHAAGDDLLCQAAKRLEDATRARDTVARLGGDEFIGLCVGIAPAQAEQLSQRIVAAFQAPFVLDGHPATVTASVGVVIAGDDATPAALLRDADTAMYRAKNGGRNAATPFTAEMRATAQRRREIETTVGAALAGGDLRVHFQPVHTVAGVMTGFEALARWPRPGRESIPPAEFIPVAEANGVIAPLTTWVLDEGLRALAGWRRRRPDLDLTLSVNIAPSQIVTGLQEIIGSALDRHGVPPAALCLEITEGALAADNELTRRLLHKLRDQGVELSIDDFGTGFSSLAYLVRLPLHEVKIDRSFIRRLPGRHSDATVAAAVVGLAHQLGFRAVAQGVETDEQLATVRRLGCDRAQGHLLGRPMARSGIDRLLAAASQRDAA